MNSAPAPENRASDARREGRAVLLALAILCAPLVVHDLVSPPSRDWSVQATVRVIRVYQRWISPLLGTICRFEPSCSRYGVAKIQKDGLIIGGAEAAWRVIRCNPWAKKGTVDSP